MFCNKCGNQIADGSSFCSACGANLQPVAQTQEQAAQSVQPQQPVQQVVYVQPVTVSNELSDEERGDRLAASSLRFGIWGFVLGLTVIFPLIFGPIAITRGVKAGKLGSRSGKRIVGIIFGILAIASLLFWFLYMSIAMAGMGNYIDRAKKAAAEQAANSGFITNIIVDDIY